MLTSLALLSAGPAGAQTFVAPKALNTTAAIDSNVSVDWNCRVTTDGSGRWVAVWESNARLTGAAGLDFDILFARSTDGGETWTAPSALNNDAESDTGDDRNPRSATDGAGTWIAVWYGFGALSGAIGFDGDILLARSADHGVTWSQPAPLNSHAGSDSAFDGYPQLSTDGAGNWVAVWESTYRLPGAIGGDSEILFTRSADNGVSWTPAAALNTNALSDQGHDSQAQVTTDGSGHWIAVWTSHDPLGGTIGRDGDILFARSTDHGATWTAPAALNTNAGTDFGFDGSPQVTTDGSGNWVAVWHSTDSLGGVLGVDADILFARSTDHGVTWTAPAALNSNAASDAGVDHVPQVATGGGVRWVAVWSSDEAFGGTIGTDFDILIAHSRDQGATWTAPVVVDTNGWSDFGEDFDPQLVTDTAGNWIPTWYSRDLLGGPFGSDFDVMVALGTGPTPAVPALPPWGSIALAVLLLGLGTATLPALARARPRDCV